MPGGILLPLPILFMAMVTAASPPVAAAQDLEARFASLDRYIEKTRVEWNAPAVSVAIVP